MKYSITYWDQSNNLRVEIVDAADEQAAIEQLANDDQHPLAQVWTVEIIDAAQER